MGGYSYRDNTHRELEQLLSAEMRKRPTKTVEEWILAERLALFHAVNERRTRAGKDPVPLSEIERVERQAVGHSDYLHKFALYCTFLTES